MFFWTKEKGIKTFNLKSKEFAEETRVMGANQGLYNGFLAAGLIWAAIIESKEIAGFFLICVLVAGLYGAYSTKSKKIILVQSIPALIGFISLILWYDF